MRKLTILKPLPISAILNADGSGSEYLLTPDPKEVWQASSTGSRSFEVDLGVATEIDTVFLGFTNAAETANWMIENVDGSPATIKDTGPLKIGGGVSQRCHGLHLFDNPVTLRKLRITTSQPSGNSPMQSGIVMIGKRFEHEYEFKAGRRPIDLSERTDLSSGGFGFGSGAIKSSFRFTFADLDDVELEELWDMIMQVGQQHPALLIEGGKGEITHNQLHYGVFERFEAYERDNPADTRWALSMTDWL